MESGSAPVPVPTLLSPNHVSGAGWFCRAIIVKMTALLMQLEFQSTAHMLQYRRQVAF